MVSKLKEFFNKNHYLIISIGILLLVPGLLYYSIKLFNLTYADTFIINNLTELYQILNASIWGMVGMFGFLILSEIYHIKHLIKNNEVNKK